MLNFTQLLKSDPCKLWQHTRTGPPTLPSELQSPTAWDHYLTTLTAPPPHQQHIPPASFLDAPFTTEEVELCLKRLNNGRSGALQGYTSELLRYGKAAPTPDAPNPPHLLGPALCHIFNLAFSTGHVLAEWQTSLVTPVFKHGDPTDTSNYRPIDVGEPLIRLYTSILNYRLTKYTEDHQLRTPTQGGYWPDLSTVYQAFVLQHVIDKQSHAHLPLYLLFVDLKAAYDKVQWPLIWQVLQRLGVSGSMLAAIQLDYTDCHLAVRVNSHCGDTQFQHSVSFRWLTSGLPFECYTVWLIP